jgi:type VI secretion system ImpC/EvpB family protein
MTPDAAVSDRQPSNDALVLPAKDSLPEPGAGSPGSSLLDAIVASPQAAEASAVARLDRFLRAPSLTESLKCWLDGTPGDDRQQLSRRLNRDVAAIDRLINDQLNAVLHHPDFQRLEASWRGVQMLVNCVADEGDPGIKIRLLHATWREVERDFERSVEFDQSQMFRKVYEDEFGTPGGEPFGVLLGDYQVRLRPQPGHPHNDPAILGSFAQVAAAAFCPFITSVHPSLFGLDSFAELEQRLDHARSFQHMDYLKWNALRKTDDARFLGLALPQVLMRLPHADDGSRVDGFCFREDVSGPDHSKYLWGNAAYAFGSVLIRSFAQSGWLADIRGVQRDIEGGGLVTCLPAHSFGTDKAGVALKISTDVAVSDDLERQLSELGFIPLCDCKDTEYSAFYGSASLQQPKVYDRPAANANARLSAMLQYMLCVSRFAHYLKVLGRDKVGAMNEPSELERFLSDWVVRYVTTDAEASAEVKARFPLREARVEVREQPGKPGAYQCVMHLAPHYELDEMRATVRVATELAPGRG